MSDNLMARDLRNLVNRLRIREAELDALAADAKASYEWERHARYLFARRQAHDDRITLTVILRRHDEMHTPSNDRWKG